MSYKNGRQGINQGVVFCSSLLLSLVFFLLLVMLLVSLFFGLLSFLTLPWRLGCWLLHSTTHSLFLPSSLFLFRIELTQCVRGLSWERGSSIFSFLPFVSIFHSLLGVAAILGSDYLFLCSDGFLPSFSSSLFFFSHTFFSSPASGTGAIRLLILSLWPFSVSSHPFLPF